MATHAVSPQHAPFESKKRVTKATLTELTVRSLKAGTYHDGKTPGFGIRIGKLKKTWFVVRTKGRIQTVVGHYPEMGLADARTAARRLLVEEPIAKSASLPFSAARDAYLDQHTGRESTKREIKRLRNVSTTLIQPGLEFRLGYQALFERRGAGRVRHRLV